MQAWQIDQKVKSMEKDLCDLRAAAGKGLTADGGNAVDKGKGKGKGKGEGGSKGVKAGNDLLEC